MELRQLEYFQMASRLRNITRAAERLRVSQPNITVAIKKLEAERAELDKQIEIEAIQKANQAVLEVKQEREIEKKLREKEKEYDRIIQKMAETIVNSNKEVLGKDVSERAKEIIKSGTNKKSKNNTKEVKANEQEKVKRTGRPRKSA